MEDTVQEPAREIPVLGEYDVVVCGGGLLRFPMARNDVVALALCMKAIKPEETAE